MILNKEDQINYMTENQGIAFGIILCFLNVLLFTIIYKRIPKWYDGITKVFQLIEIGALFTLMIVVFNAYNYKLDVALGMVAVALAGDALSRRSAPGDLADRKMKLLGRPIRVRASRWNHEPLEDKRTTM